MANSCCSIEQEPRTLKQAQLDHAREIAVDIVQKKEPDEASSIFNDGLKAVVGIKEVAAVVVSDANPTVEECCSREGIQGPQINVEACCQCSMETTPQECGVKESLSAPF